MSDIGMECASCGSDGVLMETVSHSWKYGTGDDAVPVSATIPVHFCNECDLRYINHDAVVIMENVEMDVLRERG